MNRRRLRAALRAHPSRTRGEGKAIGAPVNVALAFS
jgi:hypothetical protein